MVFIPMSFAAICVRQAPQPSVQGPCQSRIVPILYTYGLGGGGVYPDYPLDAPYTKKVETFSNQTSRRQKVETYLAETSGQLRYL